jgi:hypothetical protein
VQEGGNIFVVDIEFKDEGVYQLVRGSGEGEASTAQRRMKEAERQGTLVDGNGFLEDMGYIAIEADKEVDKTELGIGNTVDGLDQ